MADFTQNKLGMQTTMDESRIKELKKILSLADKKIFDSYDKRIQEQRNDQE